MTVALISKLICGIIVFPGLLAKVVCAEDTVTFDGNQLQITGNVRSIDERGNIEILSELTSKPLVLKGEAVALVDYDTSKFTSEVPASRIEFTNGDILPVMIESLDERHLTVSSPHVGRLVIPREMVNAIRTGNQSSKLIYHGPGPGGANEWADGDGGEKNWKFEGRAMITNETATASRDLRLPRQFVLRFTLVWQADGSPDFTIYFADPLTKTHEPVDRYFLRFVGEGLEVVRESSKRKRFHTLIKLDRSAMSFRDNRLKIEVRSNRDTGRIELLLDNVTVCQLSDPIPGIPTGGGMTVTCQNRDGFSQEIRDIEVYGKDEINAHDRAKAGGDKTSEILISREDDRWSGYLSSIQPLNGELTFFFKTTAHQLLMELPAKDISMVYLASGKPTSAVTAENPFKLRLHHGGSLTVSACRMRDGAFTAMHPLLGSLTLLPGSVCAMERVSPEPEPRK